jgi:hypothetical protein
MSLPNSILDRYDAIEVFIASNLNDALNAPLFAFSVDFDLTFQSPSVRKLQRQIEEPNLDLTRFIFDLNDYATPFAPQTSRIPTDDEIAYVVLRGASNDGTKYEFGPITSVCPFDFLSTGNPVFTSSGNAPDMATNGIIPDVMGEGTLNLHLPYYSQTLNITNLDNAQGSLLYLSFHPGMSPSVLRPGEVFTLTGAGAPEFFLGGDGGTPLFTIRTSIVNRG